MTSNQVAYFKASEDVRHNMAQEQLQFGANSEQRRHNIATENETHRTNIANEAIRHETNAINRSYNERSLTEVQRHNQAVEGIQRSYNSGNLAIAREANRIQDYNATTNRFNASQNALNQNRLYRMNVNESNSRIDLNYSNARLADVNKNVNAWKGASETVGNVVKSITSLGGKRK